MQGIQSYMTELIDKLHILLQFEVYYRERGGSNSRYCLGCHGQSDRTTFSRVCTRWCIMENRAPHKQSIGLDYFRSGGVV